MRFCLGIIVGWLLATAGLAASLEDYPGQAAWVVRADRRTGRLVRTVLAAPVARPLTDGRAASSPEIPEAVRSAASHQNLDPLLVHSVIQAESNYNPFAVSPKGAQGLMQLMPATARRYGVRNSFSITENLQAGVSYLRYLLDLFGDQELALAAYNAGEGAVIRHGGVPPYAETRQYVRSVSSKYASSRRSGDAGLVPPAEPPAAQAPACRPIEQYIDAQGDLHLLTR